MKKFFTFPMLLTAVALGLFAVSKTNGQTTITVNAGIVNSQQLNNSIKNAAAGSTIFFSTGTYSVDTTIVLVSDRIYKGENGAVIQWTGGDAKQTLFKHESTPVSNVTVDNLIFEGAGIGIKGEYLKVRNCTFRNNIITSANYPYDGSIYIPDIFKNSEITNNNFINISGTAITGYNLDQSKVSNNYFENVYQGATFQFKDAGTRSNVQISGNYGKGFLRIGMEAQGAYISNLLVEKNTFLNWRTGNPEPHGLSIVTDGSSGTIIKNNTVIRGVSGSYAGYGIEMGGNNMVVEGNVSEGFSSGIAIAKGTGNIVKNNLVRKCYGFGIQKYSAGLAGSLTITNNTVENIKERAIGGVWSMAPGTKIESNLIIREAGIWADESASYYGIATESTDGLPLQVKGNSVLYTSSTAASDFKFRGIALFTSNGAMAGTVMENNTVASIALQTGRAFYGGGTNFHQGVKFINNVAQNLKEVTSGISSVNPAEVYGNLAINCSTSVSVFSTAVSTVVPQVGLTVSASSVAPGASVSFSDNNSADTDGIAGYRWFFGDGRDTALASSNHPFVQNGSYTARLIVTDNNKAINLGSQVITVIPTCSTTGTLLRQEWKPLSGTLITDLTGNVNYPSSPNSSSILTSFEGPVNYADSYGARFRGYVCAPATGLYTFYIAADDKGELWLSNDASTVNKRLIAQVKSHTGSKVYTTYPTQKSNQIFLEEGKSYYIEALHKEGGGGDNLSVAWQLPGTLTTPSQPISATYLSEYTGGSGARFIAEDVYTEVADISIYPNPASDQVYIKLNNGFSEASEIFITNAFGQQVKRISVTSSDEALWLDTHDFPKGVYFIQIDQADKMIIKKLIINE